MEKNIILYRAFLALRTAAEWALTATTCAENNKPSPHYCAETIKELRKAAEFLGYRLEPLPIASAPVFDGRDSSIGMTAEAIGENT